MLRKRYITPVVVAGTIVALYICLYLVSPWLVSLPAPDEALLERAKREKVKAEREHREANEKYAREQSSLKELFENQRDSKNFSWTHNKILKADYVPIVYGLIIPPWEYRQAEEKKFPNSNRIVHGGCVYKKDSPEFAYVLFCTLCREEQTRWEVLHHIGSAAEVTNKDRFVSISADEATHHLLRKTEAAYPPLARQAQITGVVRMNQFISKRGRVVFVELISGPPY